MTKYFSDLNLLRDIGVHLRLTSAENASSTTETPITSGTSKSQTSAIMKWCFKCNKTLPWSEMRGHVGKHILNEDISGSKVCRLCGRDTCTIRRSSKSIPGIVIISSIMVGQKDLTKSRINLVRCPIKDCISDVWTYNFKKHFEEKHDLDGSEDYPTEMDIDPTEVQFHLS